VLDPFAGSGSTLAAANAVGYDSIGIELDPHYVSVAKEAIPKLMEVEQATKHDSATSLSLALTL
jgi:site-specific DNA-methyltransferase (adenine-specific)